MLQFRKNFTIWLCTNQDQEPVQFVFSVYDCDCVAEVLQRALPNFVAGKQLSFIRALNGNIKCLM